MVIEYSEGWVGRIVLTMLSWSELQSIPVLGIICIKREGTSLLGFCDLKSEILINAHQKVPLLSLLAVRMHLLSVPVPPPVKKSTY